MRSSSLLCASAVLHPSAYTLNGRCCCNSSTVTNSFGTFVQGFNTVNGKYCCNLQWGLFKLPMKSFNTVNGKYCCNVEKYDNNLGMLLSFNTVNGKYCCNRKELMESLTFNFQCFNTVNGKYCCNSMLKQVRSYRSKFQYRKR